MKEINDIKKIIDKLYTDDIRNIIFDRVDKCVIGDLNNKVFVKVLLEMAKVWMGYKIKI